VVDTGLGACEACKLQDAEKEPYPADCLEHLEIKMKYNRLNASAAIALLSHSSVPVGSLPAVSENTSTTELVRRARIARSLIKMRAMMQETRTRSSQLQDAIERFKDRKAKISNG
jgi:hypothetical protein